MLRQVSYRTAVMAFVFTGLWFALGLLLLLSPIPGALGIRGQMFVAWLMLLFVETALCGVALVVAAVNGILPRNVRAPRAAETLWPSTDMDSPAMPRRPRARTSGAAKTPGR